MAGTVLRGRQNRELGGKMERLLGGQRSEQTQSPPFPERLHSVPRQLLEPVAFPHCRYFMLANTPPGQPRGNEPGSWDKQNSVSIRKQF